MVKPTDPEWVKLQQKCNTLFNDNFELLVQLESERATIHKLQDEKEKLMSAILADNLALEKSQEEVQHLSAILSTPDKAIWKTAGELMDSVNDKNILLNKYKTEAYDDETTINGLATRLSDITNALSYEYGKIVGKEGYQYMAVVLKQLLEKSNGM